MIGKQWSVTVQDGQMTHFHMCAIIECKGNPKGVITKYYSNKHAEDDGWRTSSDPEYARAYETVWICPNCVKLINGEEIDEDSICTDGPDTDSNDRDES